MSGKPGVSIAQGHGDDTWRGGRGDTGTSQLGSARSQLGRETHEPRRQVFQVGRCGREERAEPSAGSFAQLKVITFYGFVHSCMHSFTLPIFTGCSLCAQLFRCWGHFAEKDGPVPAITDHKIQRVLEFC